MCEEERTREQRKKKKNEKPKKIRLFMKTECVVVVMELVHEIYCVWSRMFGIFASQMKKCLRVKNDSFYRRARNTRAKSGVGNTSQMQSKVVHLFLPLLVSNKTMRLLDVISLSLSLCSARIRPIIIVWTQLLFCVDFRYENQCTVHIQVAHWKYPMILFMLRMYIPNTRRGQLWNALALWRKPRDERVNKTQRRQRQCEAARW